MASDKNLTITVHDNLESLELLRPEWDRLLSEYPFTSVFSTYEWLVPWWRAFGNGDRLLVLAFRDASSALVGMAAMAVTIRPAFPTSLCVLRFMGDGSHDSDNLDLPVRPGYEDAFSAALLDWMEQKEHLSDICELNRLPAESLVAARLLDDLAKRKWRVLTSTAPQTVVDLAESWETQLKRISAKERGKIGLRARRLERKYNVRIRRCSEETDIDSRLQALFDLHSKHWQLRGLPGTLHSSARQQFYSELARRLSARRRLEFWVLELNGRVVAAQFGLRYQSTVFSLQEGFDPDYASDSVGYVLRSQVLKQLISEGVRRYDFLGGKDESKMRWGASLRKYQNIRFACAWSRGSLHLAAEDGIATMRSWMRTHLPKKLWKFAKKVLG